MLIRVKVMHPGEVFGLRWENIHLNGTGGLIQVTEGKTKAARRMLPMVPLVYSALKARWEAKGKPEEGWIFERACQQIGPAALPATENGELLARANLSRNPTPTHPIG